MLCPNCGTIINDDAVICEYCWYEFKKQKSLEKVVPSTNTAEGTLNSLKKALSAAQQIEEIQKKEAEFAERRQEIEKGRQEILDNVWTSGESFLFVASIVLAIVVAILSYKNTGHPLQAFVVLVVIIALCWCGIIFGIHPMVIAATAGTRESKANSYYNSHMKQLEEKEQALRESVEAFKKKPEIAGALNFLPEKYCSSEIITYLIQLFREKRVDNLKEALNIYEDDAHKQRMEEMQQKQLEKMDSKQQCPSCGARNCTLMTETTTKKDGYSAADGCCGFVLLGPIGLLCGACGSGEETKSKTYWMCQNCGNKFNA